MALRSINPFTQELLAEYEEYGRKQMKDIITLSGKAHKIWSKTGFTQRSDLMRHVAEQLLGGKEEYARTIVKEMGKPIREALAEIEKCSWVCRYYAEEAEKQLAPEPVRSDAGSSYVRFDPLGPILGIMPWNFPFWQVFRFLAPTLMAGNTALLKHASNVQGCAQHIEDIFLRAGYPEGVFRNLVIKADRVKEVIENPLVRAVTLTGSENAGANVAMFAGVNIKKTILELGGSNAFIVFEDADLDAAVETGVKARMMNAGQSCIAAKRFLVQKEIAGQFIAKFTEKSENLKMGNPLHEMTDIGPLANIEQAREVGHQLFQSEEMGATIISGGRRRKAFFEPTIVTDVTTEMPLFVEEVFGPVAPFREFETEEEAVQISNASSFGLGVTICTTSEERIERLAPQFDEGAVFVNELVKSDPRLPFGGVKHSGYGRELSSFGIREFVNIKTVFIR